MSWLRSLATNKPVAKKGTEDRFVPKPSLEDFKESNSEISREIRRRKKRKSNQPSV